MQTHNSLSQQCLSAVSFTGVSSCYANWTKYSYSFSISIIQTFSHHFSVSYLHAWIQTSMFLFHVNDLFKVKDKKHDRCLKRRRKKNKVCGHAAFAKYMVWHFTERLEQMNHQVILQVFKSIFAHRHSVSCLICVVHLNRHVKKYVIWKVCLLTCASSIMVFPSISVSPTPPFTPPNPSHEDPTSLGRDVLPLKLHGEFSLLPSSAPSAACNRILCHSIPPSLPLICLLVYFQHIPQSLCSHSSGVKKNKKDKEKTNPTEECFLFSHVFSAFLLVVFFATLWF